VGIRAAASLMASIREHSSGFAEAVQIEQRWRTTSWFAYINGRVRKGSDGKWMASLLFYTKERSPKPLSARRGSSSVSYLKTNERNSQTNKKKSQQNRNETNQVGWISEKGKIQMKQLYFPL
jgi:hypothetical protein